MTLRGYQSARALHQALRAPIFTFWDSITAAPLPPYKLSCSSSVHTTSAAHQKVPEEGQNAEKEVKVGVNAPESTAQFASEAAHAASGLAESVADVARVAVNKFKRSVGIETPGHPPLSDDVLHGAGGKMEVGEPAKSRGQAEGKYKEMSDIEKPHFEGEGGRSVNEMFPEMAEAAKLQNEGGKRVYSDEENDELQTNLHDKGP